MLKLAVKVFTRTAVRSATKSAMWYGIFAVGRSVGKMQTTRRFENAEYTYGPAKIRIDKKEQKPADEDKIADPRVEVQYKGKKK